MLKLEHNMGAARDIMLSVWGAPDHMTAILETETQHKADKFEPVYLGKY